MQIKDHAKFAYDLICAHGWRVTWPHTVPPPQNGWPIDIIQQQMEELLKDVEKEKENEK